MTLNYGGRTATVYVRGNASSAGQAAVSSPATVATGSAAVTTVDSAAASDEPTSLLDLQFTTTVTSQEGGAAVVHQSIGGSESTSAADLLLVDQALLQLVNGDDDVDFDAVPIGEHNAEGDENIELALAAAFEDDSNWWLAL